MSVYHNPLDLRQEFIPAERLRLEVGIKPTTADGLVNLNDNPSGDLGAWGYSPPINGVLDLGGINGETGLHYVTESDYSMTYFTTYWLPAAPGDVLGVRFRLLDLGGGANLRVSAVAICCDADRDELPDGRHPLPPWGPHNAAPGTYYTDPLVAPAGTAYVKVRMYLWQDDGTVEAGAPIGAYFTVRDIMVAKATPGTEAFPTEADAVAAVTGPYDYVEPLAWHNILNDTTEIRISRAVLDSSPLVATTLDPELDPSTTVDDVLRRGVPIRAAALVDFPDGSSRVEPFYTGTIEDVTTTYELDKRTKRAKPRVVIEATDATQNLANLPEPNGYGTVEALAAFTIPAARVPYRVMGRAWPVAHPWDNAPPVAHNDNAKAIDQVVIARDVEHGHVWVDRRGVIQAWAGGYMPLNFTAVRLGGPVIYSGPAIVVAGSDGSMGAIQSTGNGTITFGREFPIEGSRPYRFDVNLDTPGEARSYTVRVRWLGIDLTTTLDVPVLEASDIEGGVTWVEGYAPPNAYGARLEIEVVGSTTGQTHEYLWAAVPVRTRYSSLSADQVAADPATYTELDVSFATSSCINVVKIEWNRYDEFAQETDQVQYGPYVDQESVDRNGPYSATYVLQGADEDEAAIEAWAWRVLTANANPEREVNAMRVEVLTLDNIRQAVINDLCTPVDVRYREEGAADYLLAKVGRIATIEHEITPAGWTVVYGFEPPGSVAAPQETPSPGRRPAEVAETPHAMGYRTTAGSVPNSSWTNYGTPNSQVLRGGMAYDLATGAYTVPENGLYLIEAQVLFATTSSLGNRAIAINAGGVTHYAYIAPTANQNATPQLAFVKHLQAGSTIQPLVLQTSGATLALNVSSPGFNFVSITKVGE